MPIPRIQSTDSILKSFAKTTRLFESKCPIKAVLLDKSKKNQFGHFNKSTMSDFGIAGILAGGILGMILGIINPVIGAAFGFSAGAWLGTGIGLTAGVMHNIKTNNKDFLA